MSLVIFAVDISALLKRDLIYDGDERSVQGEPAIFVLSYKEVCSCLEK